MLIKNKPNIIDALACYDTETYDVDENGCFSKYSPAYIATNEALRWETSLFPNPQRVLTVAGSGDQALFYKLAGAKHIDTFDVSYCAHVIQDIKTTAIRNIPHSAYKDLLFDLYQTAHATDIDRLFPLLLKLPTDTLDFVRQMDGCRLFNCGESPIGILGNKLNDDEYRKLQLCVPKSFNFIWSDIASLPKKLRHKYDIINISNILGYIHPENRISILSSLSPYLHPDGRIICCEFHEHACLSNTKFHSEIIHNTDRDAYCSVFTSMLVLQKKNKTK